MNSPLRPYAQHNPLIGKRVMLDCSSVVIGQVDLADDVSIWPLVTIRGDVNFISIGARSNIQDGSVLHVSHPSSENNQGYPLIIGKNVTVGHKALLHGCTIGNNVLVGMGAIILDGAMIEDNVMLGAGSLVGPGKNLVSGYLYLGSPARQARKLMAEEIDALQESADNYVILKDRYLSFETIK